MVEVHVAAPDTHLRLGAIDVLTAGGPVGVHGGAVTLINAGDTGQAAIAVIAARVAILIGAAVAIGVVVISRKGGCAWLAQVATRAPIAILAEVPVHGLDIVAGDGGGFQR